MDYIRHMGAGRRADGQTHRLVVVMGVLWFVLALIGVGLGIRCMFWLEDLLHRWL